MCCSNGVQSGFREVAFVQMDTIPSRALWYRLDQRYSLYSVHTEETAQLLRRIAFLSQGIGGSEDARLNDRCKIAVF